MRTLDLGVLIALVALAAGCSNTDDPVGVPGGNDGGNFGQIQCTDPEGDQDRDGIPNKLEGCTANIDSDNDGIPDWQDVDSDNDGILDAVEAGKAGSCGGKTPERWPCDTDGDGYPDYLDLDSDNDGVLDQDEDPNGDGILGCCLTTCGRPAGGQEGCLLNEDGCGPGQECKDGVCSPDFNFKCSNGETSPRTNDTFGDGKFDGERGTFICRDATEDRPIGRKRVQYRKSADPSEVNSGDWHLAVETSAKYGELRLSEPRAKEAVGVIDHEDPDVEVAGFIISLPPEADNIQDELKLILDRLNAKPPAGPGTLSVRSSGAQGKSHDRFDSIRGTILDLSLDSAKSVSLVRNELVATLLGRTPASFENLPGSFGAPRGDLVIRLVTIRRFGFLRSDGAWVVDKRGYPFEDPNNTREQRIIVMGAVAARSNYQDATLATGFIVDDLSNGTAVATYADTVSDECDVATITSLPVADIIWVVDESGSMDTIRQNVVDNAKNFFSRALDSGLDFRMGVTNVCAPDKATCVQGKFCSVSDPDSNHDGGEDRFLLPSEQQVFGDCIKNPPGLESAWEHGLQNAEMATKRHLPREDNSPFKIRKNAKLVIIIATDEQPQSLSTILSGASETCNLVPTTLSKVEAAIKPFADLFKGVTDPEAAAVVHLIGTLCTSGSACLSYSSRSITHGYQQLAQQLGGQIGDVCQKDLGSTLQAIIDSIIGAASPVRLEYVPIAASLAVAVDGKQLKRSRNNGFDYRGQENSLVFINVRYEKGSEIVASYKRWERQRTIQ